MTKKALFIGFADCESSLKAFDFLNVCGYDTTPVWTEQKRGARLPIHVKEWSGDYIFHLKSYCILRKRLLDRASEASINFHPCPPAYPGAGGVNWTLYNGDKETGVTVHYMNEKVDNGEIIKVYKLPVYENDNVASLMSRIENKQLEAFYDIAGNLSRYGKKYLDNLSLQSSNQKWGDHVGRMREIDQLEFFDETISKEELERLIRATHIGRFGPKIKIHGYTFQYKG